MRLRRVGKLDILRLDRGILKCLIQVVVCVWVPMVSAVTQEITAIYRPDSAKPLENKFVNTTPVSGICADYPAGCLGDIQFSLLLPVTFDSRAAIKPGHGLREGAVFKIPSDWRRLDVVDPGTGHRATVEVRISGFGGWYRFDRPVWELTGGDPGGSAGYAEIWGGHPWDPPSPCYGSLGGGYDDAGFGEGFIWSFPVGAVCAKQAKYLIPVLSYDTLSYVYELRTPKPLSMKAGQYTGSLTYSIGPGGDFDMGDIMQSSDGALTLNFNLDVEHVLKVDIPPGGNRVALLPEGGWQAWLQNPARIPKKLFRDQTFQISASGPFSMRLICSNMYGRWCGIKNENNHLIPVAARVSLPGGIVDGTGRPVVRQELRHDLEVKFQPGHYVDTKAATLHFDVDRFVDEMLRDHAGSTYSGTVTVVWDSDV
ncbi:hypothetical protein EQV97_20970 [Pseudomonas sp. TMW22090]|uniref:hypothetical protein n=1 Tax=Pseudomonas sp. TMW22090 TaxID=2506434 RepID=UPI001F0D1325|nr:hypothetical protein [Pseudomonas sp. TMW22090]MCH4879835.1 hypothetical protein [Pseudomonas sp. TMW22090]